MARPHVSDPDAVYEIAGALHALAFDAFTGAAIGVAGYGAYLFVRGS